MFFIILFILFAVFIRLSNTTDGLIPLRLAREISYQASTNLLPQTNDLHHTPGSSKLTWIIHQGKLARVYHIEDYFYPADKTTYRGSIVFRTIVDARSGEILSINRKKTVY